MAALKFGIAVRDITPRYPVWAHGYSARTRKSAGVREPLSLRCLAVDDGSTKVLIYGLDMIGVRADVCKEVYQLIEAEVGVSYPNIVISGSHTHFASGIHGTPFSDPEIAMTDRDEAYVEDVKRKFVEAAREALENAREMQLETTRTQVPQVVYNRRTVRKSDGMVQMNLMYPEDPTPYTFSPVDSELTVLRLVDDSGVQGVLVNFGCHPVTGCHPDEDNYKFSADYPYYVRATIEDKWHCPVVFTLGTAGDAVPMNRRDDCRERIGSVLGNAAILAERTFQTDASTELKAEAVTVEAETILKTDASKTRGEYEAARKAVLAVKDKSSDEYRELKTAFDASMRAYGRSLMYPDNKWDIPVQFVAIGQTVLVSLPFEVLAEISLKMKERFPNSVLVSCCGGYQGYLPLAYEYDRVGYEATEASTHFVPGTADRLLETILEKLGE